MSAFFLPAAACCLQTPPGRRHLLAASSASGRQPRKQHGCTHRHLNCPPAPVPCPPAGNELAPADERLLTQQGGAIAFGGQQTLFRRAPRLPPSLSWSRRRGACRRRQLAAAAARFQTAAHPPPPSPLASPPVCCRHADAGILKYVDVDALLAAVLPAPLPEGAAPSQVVRPLAP